MSQKGRGKIAVRWWWRCWWWRWGKAPERECDSQCPSINAPVGKNASNFPGLGSLQSRSPREAVKIESVGEGGRKGGGLEAEGWRVTPAPSQTAQQKLAGFSLIKPASLCTLRPRRNRFPRFGANAAHRLCAEVPLQASG